MPILHSQLSGKGQTPDGKTVDLPPSIPLQQKGPVIQVTFGLADSVAQEWAKQGLQLPGTHSGLALIDTGASTTCIDEAIAQTLGLPIVDVGKMTSATHQDHPSNIYPIKIAVNGTAININVPKAMGANLQVQGLVVLIGRDVLSHCTLHYNGLNGQFTLCV